MTINLVYHEKSFSFIINNRQLPIYYHTHFFDSDYILTPRGSFILIKGECVASPSKELSQYRNSNLKSYDNVYIFTSPSFNCLLGSHLFALNSVETHLLDDKLQQPTRYITNFVSLSGVYLSLFLQAQKNQISWENLILNKQENNYKILEINIAKVPGVWYNLSHLEDSQAKYGDFVNQELILDGIIPPSSIVDTAIIHPFSGYLQWQNKGIEYPLLSEKVIDLIYGIDTLE